MTPIPVWIERFRDNKCVDKFNLSAIQRGLLTLDVGEDVVELLTEEKLQHQEVVVDAVVSNQRRDLRQLFLNELGNLSDAHILVDN